MLWEFRGRTVQNQGGREALCRPCSPGSWLTGKGLNSSDLTNSTSYPSRLYLLDYYWKPERNTFIFIDVSFLFLFLLIIDYMAQPFPLALNLTYLRPGGMQARLFDLVLTLNLCCYTHKSPMSWVLLSHFYSIVFRFFKKRFKLYSLFPPHSNLWGLYISPALYI